MAAQTLVWVITVCLIQGLPTAPVIRNVPGPWISRVFDRGGGGGGGGSAACRGPGSVGSMCLRITGGGNPRISREGGGLGASGGSGGGMKSAGNYWAAGGPRGGGRGRGTRMGLGPAQGRGGRGNAGRGGKAQTVPIGFVGGGVLKGKKGQRRQDGGRRGAGGGQNVHEHSRDENAVAADKISARGTNDWAGRRMKAPRDASVQDDDAGKTRAGGGGDLKDIAADVRKQVWPDDAIKGDEELEARLRQATVESRTKDDGTMGALLMENLDALVDGVDVDALRRGTTARWDQEKEEEVEEAEEGENDDGVFGTVVEAFEERLRTVAGIDLGGAESDRVEARLAVGGRDGKGVDDDGRDAESDALNLASLDEEDDEPSSAYSNGKRSRYDLPVETSSQDSQDSEMESQEMKRESYEEGENDDVIAKLDADEEDMLKGEVAADTSLALIPPGIVDTVQSEEQSDLSEEEGLSSYEVPPGGEEELARWREGKSTRAVTPRVRNRDRVEPSFVKDAAAIELVDEEDTTPVIADCFRDQLLAPVQPPARLKENDLLFKARVGMSKDECRRLRSSVKHALFEESWGCLPDTNFGYLEDYVNPRYRWPMKLGKKCAAGPWVREKKDWSFGAELLWGDSGALSRPHAT